MAVRKQPWLLLPWRCLDIGGCGWRRCLPLLLLVFQEKSAELCEVWTVGLAEEKLFSQRRPPPPPPPLSSQGFLFVCLFVFRCWLEKMEEEVKGKSSDCGLEEISEGCQS